MQWEQKPRPPCRPNSLKVTTYYKGANLDFTLIVFLRVTFDRVNIMFEIVSKSLQEKFPTDCFKAKNYLTRPVEESSIQISWSV